MADGKTSQFHSSGYAGFGNNVGEVVLYSLFADGKLLGYIFVRAPRNNFLDNL